MHETMREYRAEPFSVEVRRYADEDADLSHLGTFSHEWREGAIVHDAGPGQPRYFIPAKHIPHDPKQWAGVPKDVQEKVIKRYGSLVKADEAYARDDYNRLAAVARGQWEPIVISVSVKFDRYDMAERKKGGLESDAAESFLRQVEDELAAQALEIARHELERLRALLCKRR